jgi:hypothetical protein
MPACIIARFGGVTHARQTDPLARFQVLVAFKVVRDLIQRDLWQVGVVEHDGE